MYVTQLIVNPRNKNALRDISNPYEMHRTLARAFVESEYDDCRVLFRIEPPDKSAGLEGIKVIVQNQEHLPDWSFLHAQTDYCLRLDGPKEIEPIFTENQIFNFRLFANPTVKKENRRLGLYKEEEQVAWLKRKAETNGFAIHTVILDSFRLGNIFKKFADEDGVKQYRDNDIPHLMVKFNGILQVTDTEIFTKAVKFGIGSAKSFGMGLLSLAKA